MTGVNIFQNRKAQKLFIELSESLADSAAFTLAIQALFDKKILSEEGEYDVFKLTEQDVAAVYDEVVAANAA